MDVAKSSYLNVRVDKISLGDTLEHCEQFIRTRVPHQLVVVNVAKLVKAKTDYELRRIINEADLVGADGVPLVWISKLFGDPIPGRVNGTDLMEKLVERCSPAGAGRAWQKYGCPSCAHNWQGMLMALCVPLA